MKIRRRGRHTSPSQVEKVAAQAGKAAPAVAIAGALVAVPAAQQALGRHLRSRARRPPPAPPARRPDRRRGGQASLAQRAARRAPRPLAPTRCAAGTRCRPIAAALLPQPRRLAVRSTTRTPRRSPTRTSSTSASGSRSRSTRRLTVTTAYQPQARQAAPTDGDRRPRRATASKPAGSSLRQRQPPVGGRTTTDTRRSSPSGKATSSPSGTLELLRPGADCGTRRAATRRTRSSPPRSRWPSPAAARTRTARPTTSATGRSTASHGSLATFDPMSNAKSAISISGDGTNWSPWTTYTSGAYHGRC